MFAPEPEPRPEATVLLLAAISLMFNNSSTHPVKQPTSQPSPATHPKHLFQSSENKKRSTLPASQPASYAAAHLLRASAISKVLLPLVAPLLPGTAKVLALSPLVGVLEAGAWSGQTKAVVRSEQCVGVEERNKGVWVGGDGWQHVWPAAGS
jgi:hypothetical protein